MNQKGGCGKTTTAMNLARVIVVASKLDLLIDLDLDPQTHTTIRLDRDLESFELTIYKLLTNATVTTSMVAVKSNVKELSALLRNVLPPYIEFGLASKQDREHTLGNKLNEANSSYNIWLEDRFPHNPANLRILANQIPLPTSYRTTFLSNQPHFSTWQNDNNQDNFFYNGLSHIPDSSHKIFALSDDYFNIVNLRPSRKYRGLYSIPSFRFTRHADFYDVLHPSAQGCQYIISFHYPHSSLKFVAISVRAKG